MFAHKWLTNIFTHIFVPTGNKLYDVDLTATPRNVTQDFPLPLQDIDAAMCNANGINVYKGSNYYHYDSPMLLTFSRIAPVPNIVTNEMMGCED